MPFVGGIGGGMGKGDEYVQRFANAKLLFYPFISICLYDFIWLAFIY